MSAGSSTENVADRPGTRVAEGDPGRLRELLFEKLGLYVGEERGGELASALEAAARSVSDGSVDALLGMLREERLGAESLRPLLDPLLGRRDSLIHDLNEFRAYREEFERPLASRARLRGDEALRIWCLSGEGGCEPYRIGLLLETWRVDDETEIPTRVTATQRDLEPLRRSRERLWRAPELSGLGETVLASGFEPVGDRWRLAAWADESIRLFSLDPAAPGDAEGLGSFDVVFARHTLCRLMPAPRERLLSLMLERLHPGGLLFLGRGESPGAAGGSLRLVLYPGGAVYRKPLRKRGEP